MDIVRPEHTDMEEDDTISTHVDFVTDSVEYESVEFIVPEKVQEKKQQVEIEHVKLGRNSTSGSGLF